MPLFLEPDQSFPIVLDCDKDKPAETRPTFYAKSQSMRGQRKISEAMDKVFDETIKLSDMFSTVLAELEEVLVGWSNMGSYAFCRESMEIVLNYQEARELLRKVLSNQHVKAEEKKD